MLPVSGWGWEIYMWLVNRYLDGITITERLQIEQQKEPLLFIATAFFLGLWLTPQPRNKWLLSVVVIIAVIMGHVWG